MSQFIRLKDNDTDALEYINDMIDAGVITVEKQNIKSITRSVDNKTFIPVEFSPIKPNQSTNTKSYYSEDDDDDVIKELEEIDSSPAADYASSIPFHQQGSQLPASPSVAIEIVESQETFPISQCSQPLSTTVSTLLPTTSNYDKHSKKTAKMKSAVWDFFTRIDAVSARCRLCGSILKHAGNTTNLKQHIQRKHPFTANTDSSNVLSQKRKRPDSITDAEASISTSAKQKLNRSTNNNQSISAMFERAHSFVDGGSSAAKITNAVLFMLAKDNFPFATVESEGFLTLMKTIVPLYKVPSRRTITKLMDDKYVILKNKFKCAIRNAACFTITCDIWTDVSNCSYLGVTVHFLQNNQMVHGVLGVCPLNQQHASNYLSDMIVQVIESFNITPDRVIAFVTDNGANIKKAVISRFGQDKHLSCFAHILAHIVPDTLKALPAIESTVSKVRRIVTLTKRSVVVNDELRRLQIRDGKTDGTVLKFKQDVPTRWNSTLLMLERFLELSEYVYPITLKCQSHVELLNREELDVLTDIVLLLKPIHSVTVECSAHEYPTSSLIIPITRCMQIAIQELKPVTALGENFKQMILEQCHRRFRDCESTKILAIATILDPRFKKIHFQNDLACSTAIETINLQMKTDEETFSSENPQDSENDPCVVNANGNVWEFHDRIMARENVEKQDCNVLALELRQYLNQNVIPRTENPLSHWEILKTAYPKLYTCALRYLSIVATSVPSERLFSKAGAIKSDQRSRIVGSRLNNLLFLNSLDKSYWDGIYKF